VSASAGAGVLALRHVAFEDLGLLAPWLAERGSAVRYVEVPTDDLAALDPLAPDLLVVLGGPIGAYEESLYPFLLPELRLLERRLAAGRPTLGLCLGAQLMARALGARVYPGKQKEIGWSALSLAPAGRESCLRHLEATPVLHWHGDTFDLPDGTELLASTPAYRHQAFRRGPALLALQFHAEMGEDARFEAWLASGDADAAAVGTTVPRLRAEHDALGPAAVAAGRAMIADWLRGL